MPANDRLVELEELAARVPDGCRLALPKDPVGPPMAAVRALIRRGVRGLDLINVPFGGLPTELLVGAGAVRSIETSAVSLGEFGGAPRFNAAVRDGALVLKDATCPAIYAQLQAGEKGIPFIPLRGVIGSDLIGNRADWKVIGNPFAGADDDPVLVLPAIRPDVALIHARHADRHGNVWIGRFGELKLIAHAAKRTLVTVEEIVERDLMADDGDAAASLSAVYIEAIAIAQRGAWPLAFGGLYSADEAHLRAYVDAAESEAGFRQYLDRYVLAAAPSEPPAR